MRCCLHCGEEFSVLRHVFLRGEFCSQTCGEVYHRDEANLAARRVIAKTNEDTTRLRSAVKSTAAGHVAVWTGIIQAAKHLSNRQLMPTKQRPSVITLRHGTAHSALYFIGAGLAEFRLAQLISARHSIFGIDIPWPLAWRDAATQNRICALPTMEQLAAPYVTSLMAHMSTSSSVILVGYSFAGLMAFEAAHQLQKQGFSVEMVILLDAPAIYLSLHQVAWRKLQKEWKQAPTSTGQIRRSFAARVQNSFYIICVMLVGDFRTIARFIIQHVLRDPGPLTTRLDELGKPLHWKLIERLNAKALSSYQLHPLNCRGILFRADPNEEGPARSIGGSLGWDGLFTRGLEIIQVTGNHIKMMRHEPHNLMLARALSQLLTQHSHRCRHAR